MNRRSIVIARALIGNVDGLDCWKIRYILSGDLLADRHRGLYPRKGHTGDSGADSLYPKGQDNLERNCRSLWNASKVRHPKQSTFRGLYLQGRDCDRWRCGSGSRQSATKPERWAKRKN